MTDRQVIIGMDPHKLSNTIAVLTRDETMLTRRRFQNSDDGIIEMLDAVSNDPDRVWAVEGANGVGRAIAQRLTHPGSTERSHSRRCSAMRSRMLVLATRLWRWT